MPEAKTLAQIAAATGVSTFSVRSALGRVAAREQAPAGDGALGGGQPAQPDALSEQDEDGEQQEERLLVLPDPLSRDAERALARFGLLGEGAEPVFAPGPRYPLAGLLLALPALEATGLIGAAREACGRLPASMMSANTAGDQPPRSKRTVTSRPSPTTCRSCGTNRLISAARDSDGSATTMSPGWPPASVTKASHSGRTSSARCGRSTSP